MMVQSVALLSVCHALYGSFLLSINSTRGITDSTSRRGQVEENRSGFAPVKTDCFIIA